LQIIKDATVLFTLKSTSNIVSNINIIGNNGPIFKIVEKLGDAAPISGTNSGNTMLKAIAPADLAEPALTFGTSVTIDDTNYVGSFRGIREGIAEVLIYHTFLLSELTGPGAVVVGLRVGNLSDPQIEGMVMSISGDSAEVRFIYGVAPSRVRREIPYVAPRTVDTVRTRYALGGSTLCRITQGIAVNYVNTIAIDATRHFALLGDSIEASLYTGYSGTYASKTELTKTNGNIIKANNCRTITANYYRGFINTLGDANEEEITLSRTAATGKFVVKKDNTQYTQDLGVIYNGLVSTINGIDQLGDLGLKIAFKQSRFVSSTVTATKRHIILSFGSYNVTITNPLNATAPTSTTSVSSKLFNIYTYPGSNTLEIVAGKISVKDGEKYSIYYSLASLELYTSNDEGYVCDASKIATTAVSGESVADAAIRAQTWTLRASFGDASLRTKDAEGVLIGTTFKHLRIKRISTNIASTFTTFFNCPRPQLRVEAVSRLDVKSLPYTPYTESSPLDGPVPKVYYVDMDFDKVKRPFFINNALVSGLNDIKVSYVSPEKYTSKRVDNINNSTLFPVPGNKITVKLFPKLKTDFTYVTDSTKSEAENDAANGLVATVIAPRLIEDFTTFAEDQTTFTSSYNTATLLAGFTYAQPLDIITSSVQNTVNLGDFTVRNIRVNNIHAFSAGTGTLDMDPGDSISLDVYGLRLTPKKTANSSIITGLTVTFVKYSTGYAVDFYNQNVQSIMNELSITPLSRSIKTFYIDAPASVYSNTESLMSKMLKTSRMNGETPNPRFPYAWSSDTDYATTPLETRLSALDGRGKELLFKMLAVSPQFPVNLLLISQPDLINFKSATGASKFRVNYNGVLMVNRIHNEQLIMEEIDTTTGESGTLAQQLFAGRVTKFSAP
jgi:hypothetical protein